MFHFRIPKIFITNRINLKFIGDTHLRLYWNVGMRLLFSRTDLWKNRTYVFVWTWISQTLIKILVRFNCHVYLHTKLNVLKKAKLSSET